MEKVGSGGRERLNLREVLKFGGNRSEREEIRFLKNR